MHFAQRTKTFTKKRLKRLQVKQNVVALVEMLRLISYKGERRKSELFSNSLKFSQDWAHVSLTVISISFYHGVLQNVTKMF